MNKKTIISILLALVAMVGKAKGKAVVWESPATAENTEIEGFFSTLLEITRVEFADDETRVMMHVAMREDNWVRFASDTYLKADGKRYALKSCEGLELDKEVYLTDHGHADVVFHFEPLPKKTLRFDFIEGDGERAFKLLGVENVATRAQRLFSSNWRNEQTGEWEIGFYDDCAVYDCQFWNYKQRQQKGDKYELVLEHDGKEIAVSVGRSKNGQRTMTIDGKKGVYSFITSITLPDYPMKDTRTAFKDSHYETDTVTFIGWLKDMPESLKRRGNEYTVSYNDAFTDNQVSTYAKIDSLGRFVMKIPLLNSSEVFFDWNRTFIRTLFEPGETYFMLYDFKEGHKLFMGSDCRMQNEMLASPMQWINGRAEDKMDEAAAMSFLEKMKAEKTDKMNELDKVVAAHPFISDRYIQFVKGNYNICEGRELMQGRFEMKDRVVPTDYLKYVNQQHWQRLTHPYTLNREFSTFIRDYVDQLDEDKYAIRSPLGMFTVYTDMIAPTLLRYRNAGKLTISDEELAAVTLFSKEHLGIHIHENEEEIERSMKEFEQQDYVKQYRKVEEREDVKHILADESPLFSLYHKLTVLDSIGCDQDLRDIIITNHFYSQLNYSRQPLSDFVMRWIEEHVSMPSAKSFLRTEQQKYLDIQNRDISKSNSLKSTDDVANMSDGEKILRKITEPYRGKLILLDIWGTWCGPCKEALSHSQEEYERLKDFDLVYLYLANSSDDESWKSVIKEYNLMGDNVVHYNLPESQQSAIEHFLQVHSFPTYKLIDRDGFVLDVNADPRNLEGLARLLEQMKSEK